MKACATASGVVVGLFLGAASLFACSGGTAEVPPPPPPDNAAPPPVAATASVDMPSDTPPPPTAPKANSMADCKNITGSTSTLNEPPAGATVMNNAMTSGDAGASDRMAPLIDLVKTHRDGFRCCYDFYSKTNPNQGGRIQMVWALKGDGSVDKITVDAAKSTLHAPDAEACMLAIAQGISYPPSPLKKNTTFTYPFEFRPKL